MRRGVPNEVSLTNASTSMSTGRVPSSAQYTQEPGMPRIRPESMIAEGFLTSCMPLASMSNTPISLVDPKRFLTARRMRNALCASPSKYRTVSTKCSSTRGPAMLPSLVTWPMMNTAVLLCLAKRASAAAHSRTWLTLPDAEATSA